MLADPCLGVPCPLAVLSWRKPVPWGQHPADTGFANTDRSLTAILSLKVNIAPQRKSALIIMSQTEVGGPPSGVENAAVAKVTGGLLSIVPSRAG